MCLFERAKRLVTKPSVISKQKKHLSSVLVSNGYPLSFSQKITKTRKPCASAESTSEYKSTAVLSYVKDLSKQRRRRCLQRQSIRAVFKSQATLRSHLVRPKDEPAKQNGLVYRIPCECGKVHIGETGRLCKTESKSITEASDLSVPRPPLFQQTLTTPDTTPFETE